MTEPASPSAFEESQTVLVRAERLFTPAEVEAAVDRMAEEINLRLCDENPLLLCVMVGGMVLGGMLLPRLRFPLQVDYLHVTRYHGDTSGSQIRWIKHPDIPLRGRVVLVVDDVLDEGITLAAIVEACEAEGAREILTAVLVDKVRERPEGVARTNFTGIQTVDRYLFGYGMDFKNYLRNADGIYAVSK
jgi:hypoxanthine phosphoribosyltransferase